jgi:hypothetical protein
MKQLSISKYLPKKHQEKVEDFYSDIDGCWLILKEGYVSTTTECSTIHEDNIKDIKKQFKTIVSKDAFDKGGKLWF